MLIKAGFQVPVIAGKLLELNGNVGGVEPKHNGPMAAKVGVIEFVISISIVATEAHCPASGVKVYVAIPTIDVLMVNGFQVPVIGVELVELVGKTGAEAFKHKGPIALKVGVCGARTVIFKVVVLAHCPAVGVNV